MLVKPLSVCRETLKNNILLAPMAGYTDYAFRHNALKLGYGFCFTELVSAKGLCYGGDGSKRLLYSDGDYDKTGVQLFGSDPYYMRKALESEELKDFKIVDINMGCPVPKVFKNGEGSALLLDINKAEKIVKECVKSGKIITAKIRTGQKRGDDVAKDFAVMLEQAGASMVTIHGRVREAYYSGEVDYNAIKKAKDAVNIPVIANGGIFTVQDAKKIVDETGVDGIMLARGAIDNPFLISELLHKTPPCTLKQFMIDQLELLRQLNGEKSVVEFRKFLPCYFKGQRNSKEMRQKLMGVSTVTEFIDILSDLL